MKEECPTAAEPSEKTSKVRKPHQSDSDPASRGVFLQLQELSSPMPNSKEVTPVPE